MKITAKLREEAAILCSAAASADTRIGEGWNWQWNGPSIIDGRHSYVRELEVSPDAAELADWAVEHVFDTTRSNAITVDRFAWAEAEALLRTGFTPEGWE